MSSFQIKNTASTLSGALAAGTCLPLASLNEPFCFSFVYFLLAATLFRNTPMSEISISTRSPGFRNFPVVDPTPEMVPVLIRSPGSSVTIAEMYSIILFTG